MISFPSKNKNWNKKGCFKSWIRFRRRFPVKPLHLPNLSLNQLRLPLRLPAREIRPRIGVVTTPVDNIPPVVAPPQSPGLPDTKTLAALKDVADHPVTVDDVSDLPPANEESASYRSWLG